MSRIFAAVYLYSLVVLAPMRLTAQVALPKAGFQTGWITKDTLEQYDPEQLFAYIDGGAEQYLELGFRRLQVQRYTIGHAELELDLYQMESPEAALGIYLITCGTERPITGLAARNSGGDSQLNIVRNEYFVQINNAAGDKAAASTMVTLARALLASLPKDLPIPILERLPTKNRVKGTLRIFRGPLTLGPIYNFGQGDVFKLDGKVFGLSSEYADSGGSSARLVIPYPDTSSAREVFTSLRNRLDPRLAVIRASDRSIVFKDGAKYGQLILRGREISAVVNLTQEPSSDSSP